ncbi:MAG TPA: ABC transporter permease [Dehalococcoidales bacterium]
MRGYIIRRLLLMVPTLFFVTVVVFSVCRLIPGSVIDLMVTQQAEVAGMGMSLTADHIKHQLGLDVPLHIQYGKWVAGVFRGDLGSSLWTDRPVVEDLARRLPVTAELGFLAVVTALLLALPIGVYSAMRQDTGGDYVGRTVAVLAISLPAFWTGTLVMVYPSVWWGWSPPVEYIPIHENLAGNFLQFLLPAVLLGMTLSGTTMRMTRTMMLEVLRQDYIRTAWSKGLKERVVILRHALKNALLPVVSMIGILLTVIVGGAVVIEQIFALPGIGLLMIEAINKRDYPILSGVNLVVAGFVMVMNLVVDLTYAWLDPRVKYR